MAYEQKDNSGSLFKNDRKEQDNHADYRGTIKVAGVEYWIDAWLNESSNGTKYMGLKVKPKDGQQAARPQAQPQPAAFDTDLDSDVPF
jgi:uncharacterized protein (DUF736 family)